MMTRRTFMGTLAIGTAAFGFGLGGVLAQRRRLTMAEIGPETLLPLGNSTVSLHTAEGRTLRAVVQDVSSIRHPAKFGAPSTEQVSLLLAADDPDASAGTYRIESDHVILGDLYLSPVGQAGRQRRLEAVITRIL